MYIITYISVSFTPGLKHTYSSNLSHHKLLLLTRLLSQDFSRFFFECNRAVLSE